MAKATVLLCTEGTYPFAGGGVSTWCDILCNELSEYEFLVYTVTGAPEVRLRYELPANARRLLHVPLWGVSQPADYVLAGLPARELRARRRRTTPRAVAEEFLPLLRRLLGGLAGDPAEDDGRLVWELWRFFAAHDWRACWKSRAAWDLFTAELGGAPDATVDDLTAALGWLYHCLMPLAAPLPRTDLVHTTIAGFPGLAGVAAKHEWGTPFAVTEHGVWLRERYIAISAGELTPFAKRFLMHLSRYVARVNYACADVVSPVTDFNRRWELPCGVPPERIETIRNGVDPGLFVPRPKPARTADRPTVVAAARVFPLKDMETMIRSAAVAREQVPDVHYLVYGSLDADVPYVERCRALIAELELDGTFEFAGHHSRPAELYCEGDVCALSSISEAFPYTVLEAMSCGRPVVGTDVGGVREALDGFGLVVAPRDHEAFGSAIVTLLRDDLLRAQMGRQAREAVLARYRITFSVDGYRRLYERALAGAPAHEPAAAVAA
ncbi:MAG TPA: GT4 family glycosyltransferase PelF [Conexibacter sp.]|jgi:glycosyltransferase involved in cell wall biosynthesis|nr:GT4 family glycosyltransferase PelF [Conexibacter sp.]